MSAFKSFCFNSIAIFFSSIGVKEFSPSICCQSFLWKYDNENVFGFVAPLNYDFLRLLVLKK